MSSFPPLTPKPPKPPKPPSRFPLLARSSSKTQKLAKLYEAHGQRWAEIARHLEGRTDQQCMGRWRRHLDPSVKKDAWSPAEDAELVGLHDSLGPRWSNISKMLTGRTAQQCRARWFQLSAAEEHPDGGAEEEGVSTVTVRLGGGGGQNAGPDAKTRRKELHQENDRAAAASEKGGRESSRREHKQAAKVGQKRRRNASPSEPSPPQTPAVTDEGDVASAGPSANHSGSDHSEGKQGATRTARGDKGGASNTRAKKEDAKGRGGGVSGRGEEEGEGAAGFGEEYLGRGNRAGDDPAGPGPGGNTYGAGGGLDLLAMLYSAAVTYEQGFAAAAADAARAARTRGGREASRSGGTRLSGATRRRASRPTPSPRRGCCRRERAPGHSRSRDDQPIITPR